MTIAKQKKRTKKQKKNTPIQKTFWKDKQLLIGIGIILFVTFIAFIPSLSNAFVNWDDDVNLLDNPNLRAFDWPSIKNIFVSDVIGGYTPLTILSFAIERAIVGFDPLLYHIDNLLLHMVVVFFVYRVLLMMNISHRAALIATLLFAIHPMRVESVAWVTERKDVLFGAFYFAALFNYLKYLKTKERKNFYYAIAIVLFVFSLLSKIQAVALPLSMLAMDYYFKRPLKFKLILEKLIFFALALGVGVLGVMMLSENDSLDDKTKYSFLERLVVGAYSYCVYLVKFIFPFKMSPLYPYPSSNTIPNYFYGSIPVIMGIAYWMYYAFKNKQRDIIFGFAFFTFNVMFMLQILGAGQGFLADRFTYIPYFGLFFLVGIKVDQFITNNKTYGNFAFYGMGAYALLFVAMTWNQCGIWKNGGTLWNHVLTHYQNTATPWSNLGHYYKDIGQTELAIKYYNKTISLDSKAAGTLNSMGKLYFDMGNTNLAMDYYNKSITADPEIGEVYINRGAALGASGRYEESLKDLNKGIDLDPKNPNGYLNRSLLYLTTGKYELALADNTTYLQHNAYNSEIWFERAMNKRRLARDQDALLDLNHAIKLERRNVFLFERAKLHQALGNTAQAIADAREAQSLGSGEAGQLLKTMQ